VRHAVTHGPTRGSQLRERILLPMPSPRRMNGLQTPMNLRNVLVLSVAFIGVLGTPRPARAQIATTTATDGRRLFVNAEPPVIAKLSAHKPANQSIYLQSEITFTGTDRPAVFLDRDGAEKLVREAAERHKVDPALVRAVIETESNWNPAARSHKGAVGLMQLIPTTAMRFGVNDVYSPRQNVDAGVKYLKTLLERYRGNLDLALAAYNAGEGAVDRAHGVPSFLETQSYVRKVQNAYYRPGSGRMDEAYTRSSRIHREVDANGRIIFTNE
jgi:transglycosylase-like protein with SLT domain